MAFYLAHAGSKLQKVTVAGDVSDLTLFGSVTMSSTRRTRFAMLNSSVLAVHGPSLNVRVRTSDLATRPMSIAVPGSTATAAAGAAGVLTGDYSYKVSFTERSGSTLISESPLSSASNTVTLTSQRGSLTGIPTSTDTGVTDRRIYRTTTGGSTYFPLAYIADNSTTTYTDNTADASLGTTAADTDLGNPAGTTSADYLTLLVAWKDRLWAVSSASIDDVFYSGVDKWYAWAAANYLPINPKGQGTSGVTAFLPRRDVLGVAKRRMLTQIVGSSAATYQVITVNQGVGVFAPDSVVVIRDTAYFLAENGPYSWGPEGVRPLADARVSAWFTMDSYFNRTRFESAWAAWNQATDCYELHLAAAGSNTEDRWVSYDLQRGTWLGPHRTSAMTPSAAALLEDIDGRSVLVVGGDDGKLYRANDATFLDGASTAIAYSVTTCPHSGGEPGLMKYWGQPTVYTRAQAAGTMTVTPTLGQLGASAGSALSRDLTKARETLPRLGVGELCSLTFEHSTSDQDCQLLGYEIPVSVVGQR